MTGRSDSALGTTPDEKTVRSLVEAATRAPSVHNTQPWRWEYDGEALHLYADESRRLRHGDPDGRDLMISCGAALHHAVVAAGALGWDVAVRRLPDPARPEHLASLAFEPVAPSEMRWAAFEAIHLRRTDRRRPSSSPVPRAQLEALIRCMESRGGTATVVPDALTDRLRDLMMLSAVVQHSSAAYIDELASWTHSVVDDGVPDSSTLFLPGRAFSGGADTRFPSGFLLDHAETDRPRQEWLLLGTPTDDTLARLQTGEALSAILLLAVMQGLAIVPYTQPIEVDLTRRGIEAALLGGTVRLQVVLRVAVPPRDGPRLRPTRRRPVEDVLRVAVTP